MQRRSAAKNSVCSHKWQQNKRGLRYVRDSKERQNPFHTKAIVAGVAAAIGAGGAGLAWSAELEEVVVTARKGAESSQDIPMMVQSISGEDLQKQGITTLEDFSRHVAGLNVQTTTPGRTLLSFGASVMVAGSWSTPRLPST